MRQTKAQKAARAALNAEIKRQAEGTSTASSEQILALVRAIVQADRAAAAVSESQQEMFKVQDCKATHDTASFVTGQINFFALL